jgi:hypothetical protein
MGESLIFSTDGSVRAIYSDKAAELMREVGVLTIRRASMVEPTADGQWTADLTPVGGPACLGPYVTRREALDAELDWLEMNDVPIPG